MTETRRVVVDGTPVGYEEGDSVAMAILRHGEHPHHGGTLCLAGDCPNCVAEIDGVAYVRTCQTPARPGLVVRRHPAVGGPAMPTVAQPDVTASPQVAPIHVTRSDADLVVIGRSHSGTEAAAAGERSGRDVLVLDANDGAEVVAIYAGPTVIARTSTGMLHVHAAEVLVATGAAEIHPVCPGNGLAGIVTARAAERLHDAGVDLGDAVAVGEPPNGVPHVARPGSTRPHRRETTTAVCGRPSRSPTTARSRPHRARR